MQGANVMPKINQKVFCVCEFLNGDEFAFLQPLANSLNLWHVLAQTVNKLPQLLQANPRLYVLSQLWTDHFLILYGISQSTEQAFCLVFFILFVYSFSPLF